MVDRVPKAWTLRQLIEMHKAKLAQQPPQRKRAKTVAKLTPREADVVNCLKRLREANKHGVAEALGMSPEQARKTLETVYLKGFARKWSHGASELCTYTATEA